MTEPDLRAWVPAERREQLSEFSQLCHDLAAGFALHDPRASAKFRERGEEADGLLRDGWEQRDLNALAGQFPDGVWWLNPKAADDYRPEQPWQEPLVELHRKARLLAFDLRAVAVRDH